MKILGIDPGPDKSAFVVWNGNTWVTAEIVKNEVMRTVLLASDYDYLAIEMVAHYGMAVGKEVFETCVWIGRFIECSTRAPSFPCNLVYRREIKMHFCNSMKAKDANIRQAILDRFGGKEKAIGNKATPGPLYGIKSHLWSALAIALFIEDQNR